MLNDGDYRFGCERRSLDHLWPKPGGTQGHRTERVQFLSALKAGALADSVPIHPRTSAVQATH